MTRRDYKLLATATCIPASVLEAFTAPMAARLPEKGARDDDVVDVEGVIVEEGIHALLTEFGMPSVSSTSFRKAVEAVSGDTLRVRVNSPGGVISGLAGMLNTVERAKAGGQRVEMSVEGRAYSAAAALLAAADHASGSPLSDIMVHDVHTVIAGNATQLAAMAGHVRSVTDEMYDLFARKTGKSVDEVRADVADRDLYMTSAEAHAWGLLDEVREFTVAPERAAAAASAGQQSLALAAEAFAQHGNTQAGRLFDTPKLGG